MAPCGRRERKKRETREALEAAALRLFARKGFDHTTVEDICDEVDVSTRTFNRYFPRKEDVLFSGHEEQLARFRRLLAAHPPTGHLLDPVRAAVKATVAERRPRRDLDLIWARLVHEHPVLRAQRLAKHEAFAATITGYAAERLGLDPATDPRPALIGGCCVSVVDTALRHIVAHPSEDDDALIDLLFDTLTGDFDLSPADR